MRTQELSWLERTILSMRCSNHVALGQFRNEKGEHEAVTGFVGPITPFIAQELSNFMAAGKRLQAKKWCSYQYYDPDMNRRKKFVRFADAMTQIDARVRKLEETMALNENQHKDKETGLRNGLEECQLTGATAKIQLYKSELGKEHEEYRKRAEKDYKRISLLLSEKLRLIEAMNARIQAAKAHCLLRIRFYYNRAAESLTDLPVWVYSEKNLVNLCPELLERDFTGLLEETREHYNRKGGALWETTE